MSKQLRSLSTSASLCALALLLGCGKDHESGSGVHGGPGHVDGGRSDGGPGGGGQGGGDGGGDSEGGTPLSCTFPSVLSAPVVDALRSGDALAAGGADTLLDAARAAIEFQRTQFDKDLAHLFGLNPDGSTKPDGSSLTAVSWDPTHDAALLTATPGENKEALISNDTAVSGGTVSSRGLAVIGRRDDTPYLVFSSNPLRTSKRDASGAGGTPMDTWTANAIDWLVGGVPQDGLDVVLAHLDQGYWFPDETATRAWLRTEYGDAVRYHDADACDGAALAGCLDRRPDLLIVSQAWDEATQDRAQIVAGVASALEAGIPVMYLQVDGSLNELGEDLLALFKVSNAGDNYWSKLRVTNQGPEAVLGKLTSDLTSVDEMLTRLSSGDYGFTLATANANDAAKAVYQTQFAAGASVVQKMMNGFDTRGEELFASCGNELPKLLALLGDRLRQDVDFPMKTASSPIKAFLRSYYADHAVYNARRIVPAQPDRGTFDSRDLSAIVPRSKDLTIVSRPSFKSAGVYALPGRTMTVRRTDNSAVKVGIFVNSLRSSSVDVWNDAWYGGYARPKYLQSAAVPVAPGQTIRFTSPYGGPVQIQFDTKDQTVTLHFENVGQHPHWRSSADDASFEAAMAENAYDWAEIATDGFEVHSKREKLEDSLTDDARWNTPVTLAATVRRYTFDAVHVLAGMRGDGVEQVPEIIDWAATHNLTVPTIDVVKHGNMDQSTCGSGCSGNPYDAAWSFGPIAHGDLHELGHSLQNGRFQLSHKTYSYANHSVTNWSPFYGAARYFDDHGGAVPNWGIGQKEIFQALQAAYTAGDRAGAFSTRMDDYFANNLSPGGDSGIRDNYAFFLQAMMAAKREGKLLNGYHAVPRVHLLDRAFRQALSSAATWEAARTGLGFSGFTLEAAKAITNNDFMAVAMSFVTGLDYRDFFAMWGLQVGATAASQIQGFQYPAVARAFFVLADNDHKKGALSTRNGEFARISINGTTAWPL